MRAPIRLALGEGLFRPVIGVRQVVNMRQELSGEGLAIGQHAATEMPPKPMP